MSLPQITIPPVLEQASMEDITYGIDCTALLGGQTIDTFTVALSQKSTPITLEDSPTASGNLIAIRIRAAVLTTGGEYQLLVTVNPTASTNIFACVLQITCPF